jgi:hypothetical protein
MSLAVIEPERRLRQCIAAEHRQIDAGRERAAFARDHQHPDLFVEGAAGDDILPFVEHLAAEAVQPFGPVQRHRRDTIVAHVEFDFSVIHRSLPVLIFGIVCGVAEAGKWRLISGSRRRTIRPTTKQGGTGICIPHLGYWTAPCASFRTGRR